VAVASVLAGIIFLSSGGFSLFIGRLGVWGLYVVASMTAARGMISILVLLGLGVVPLLGMLTAGDRGLWVVPAVVTVLMFALVVFVGIFGAVDAFHRAA